MKRDDRLVKCRGNPVDQASVQGRKRQQESLPQCSFAPWQFAENDSFFRKIPEFHQLCRPVSACLPVNDAFPHFLAYFL